MDLTRPKFEVAGAPEPAPSRSMTGSPFPMENSVTHAASGKLRSVVVGLGSYLPKRIVSNADLEKSLDTTDEWIVQRTGIRQRHVAAEDEPTSRLGLYAAQAALADAGLQGSDLDLDNRRDVDARISRFQRLQPRSRPHLA